MDFEEAFRGQIEKERIKKFLASIGAPQSVLQRLAGIQGSQFRQGPIPPQAEMAPEVAPPMIGPPAIEAPIGQNPNLAHSGSGYGMDATAGMIGPPAIEATNPEIKTMARADTRPSEMAPEEKKFPAANAEGQSGLSANTYENLAGISEALNRGGNTMREAIYAGAGRNAPPAQPYQAKDLRQSASLIRDRLTPEDAKALQALGLNAPAGMSSALLEKIAGPLATGQRMQMTTEMARQRQEGLGQRFDRTKNVQLSGQARGTLDKSRQELQREIKPIEDVVQMAKNADSMLRDNPTGAQANTAQMFLIGMSQGKRISDADWRILGKRAGFAERTYDSWVQNLTNLASPGRVQELQDTLNRLQTGLREVHAAKIQQAIERTKRMAQVGPEPLPLEESDIENFFLGI